MASDYAWIAELVQGDRIDLGRGVTPGLVINDAERVVHEGAYKIAVEYREDEGKGPRRVLLDTSERLVRRLGRGGVA